MNPDNIRFLIMKANKEIDCKIEKKLQNFKNAPIFQSQSKFKGFLNKGDKQNQK